MDHIDIIDKYIIILGQKKSISKIYIEVIKNKLKDRYKDDFKDKYIIENLSEEEYSPKQFIKDVQEIEKLLEDKCIYIFVAKYSKEKILDSENVTNLVEKEKFENIIFSFVDTMPLLDSNITS